jgi:hypothetical protein
MKKKAKRRVKPARKAAKKGKSRKPAKARAVAKKSTKAKPKKAVKKKTKAAKAAPPQGVVAPPNSVLLGLVEDYFAKIGVIALTLQAAISQGSKMQVLGHTTRIEQLVDSMQIDHLPVTQAAKGAAVGIKVIDRARRGDHVYLIR